MNPGNVLVPPRPPKASSVRLIEVAPVYSPSATPQSVSTAPKVPLTELAPVYFASPQPGLLEAPLPPRPTGLPKRRTPSELHGCDRTRPFHSPLIRCTPVEGAAIDNTAVDLDRLEVPEDLSTLDLIPVSPAPPIPTPPIPTPPKLAPAGLRTPPAAPRTVEIDLRSPVQPVPAQPPAPAPAPEPAPKRTEEDAPGFYRSGRYIAWIVAVCYYAASVYIFRNVITAIPSVLAGDAVIGGDELVPFFNVWSQLLDQAAGKYSELTNGYEFRVRYSLLTTWVRYYAVLPFAIVIVIPTVAYLAYRNICWFVLRALPTLDSTSVYIGAAFPVGLAYLIMTYAKITHFYTLVVGLMLLTVASTTLWYGVIFRRLHWARYVVAACVVTLFNPAVHYLILFTLIVQITVFVLLVGELSRWFRRGGFRRLFGLRGRLTRYYRKGQLRHSVWVWWRWWTNKTTTGRCVAAMAMLLFVTLVPYALFVRFIALRGVENLAETVPSDYYFIRDASVSWLHVLSWDLAGIMDKILFGDYLAKTPRFPNIAYSLLLIIPFLVKPVRVHLYQARNQRQLFASIGALGVFATWATIGYAEPHWFPTFHRTMAAITRTLYSTGTPVGELTLSISSTIVQVLRFPHRFQLILFVVGPLVMTVGLAGAIGGLRRLIIPDWVYRRSKRERRQGGIMTLILGLAVGTVFFTPFFSNEPYRRVFGSGDFGQFLAPYPLGDLRDIRDALDALPTDKTVVLPPTETSKLVVDTNGVPHKFIDKFYMYYLDKPSFYYGLTGATDNKFQFFLILRSMYYQQDWWINIARDIGLRYIVIDRSITDNGGIGAEYLPNVETFVEPRLTALPDEVELRHENDSFALYEIVDRVAPDRDVLLIDTTWNGFLDLVYDRPDLSNCYDLQYLPLFDEVPADREVLIVSEDATDGAIDVWARQHPEATFPASPKMFAFDPNIVSSNYYLSPMFRLFLFFSNTKWNRTETITPGIFGTLNGSFIGVPRATSFVMNTHIPEQGRYRVLLRTATTVNEVTVRSEALGLNLDLDLNSPPDAMGLVEADSVYSQNRVIYDTGGLEASALEPLIGDELVAVNYRFRYLDLGVVEASAGVHPIVFTKHDDNPMLVESVVLMPEETFGSLTYPPGVTRVESLGDLDCAERVGVGADQAVNYVDPAANGEHRDLSDQELTDLAAAGVNRLEPDDTGGLSGEVQTLVMVVTILIACGTFVVWRSRQWQLEETIRTETLSERHDK